MRRRSVQARLDDILEAISGIRPLVRGLSFEQFAAVWHIQRATERGWKTYPRRAAPSRMT